MFTRFFDSQSVELTVQNQPVPLQHYLRQPRRLVYALFDSSRVQQLREDCFRLEMRPLKFLMLTLQPTADLRIWAEPDGTIRVQSIRCEVRGVDFINDRFSFNLVGRLTPEQRGEVTYLQGQADLEVRVDVPPPLLFTPQPLVEATGNGLLHSVLLTIKHRLMHQLVADYRQWAIEQERETWHSSQNFSQGLQASHSSQENSFPGSQPELG